MQINIGFKYLIQPFVDFQERPHIKTRLYELLKGQICINLNVQCLFLQMK